MELDSKPPAEIVIERPTGPRITASEPLSLGQLVAAKASKTSKSVVSAAVVGASAGLAFLTRHKFAVGIGASTVTAIATHLIIASMMMGMVGDKAPTAAASYTGPGDVVSGAKAYWGFRCYNSAYSGNVALLETSGDATAITLSCATGGILSASLNLTSNCGADGSGCTVKTLYDQSGAANCTGACDATQATEANRPVFNSTCAGLTPVAPVQDWCMVMTATKVLVTPSSSSISQPITMSCVTRQDTYGGSYGQVMEAAGTFGAQVLFSSTDGNALFYTGSGINNYAAADATWFAFNFSNTAAAGGTSNTGINGTDHGNTGTGGGALSGAMKLGNGTFTGIAGKIAECGVWPSDFTGTPNANMSSNQRTNWGF